jgi:maltooligosyltrehalose trehalohydrolase
MSLRVWAPDAGRVDVLTGEQRHRMASVERGWWEAAGPTPDPDTDYAISLDGGPPLPDPRSQHLPSGVHGPSRRVDHDAFEWSDAGFAATPLASAVIYELHIGTFSPAGTFDGAADHLEHLVDLGVTHVEIMPVHAFAGVHGWGYDVAGFFAPHEPYGGPDGLKRLVDACHAHGLAVLLDVVYNHMGPEGCYLGQFGPYMTDRFQTPWGSAVNLGDAGADEVRQFIIDNALMWLRDYHVDGLRIDAVHAFIDLTASHLLEDMADAVAALADELGRELVLVAESDLNDPRIVRSREFGGYGLDAQWSDDFHHALHTTLTGESDGYYQDFVGVADLMRALEHGWVYEGQYSPHRGRRHGRSTAGLPFRRFVGFAQNHDQVGNRARGERLSQLVGDDELRIAAALLICGPFVPLLFQGEEWGARTPFCYFADFDDEALRSAVREGRRREFAAFGWRAEDIPDPMDRATFEASRLDWEELAQESHAALLEWYRTLIAIRAATRGLQGVERPELRAGGDGAWLDVTCGDRRVVVNLAAEQHSIEIGSDMAIAAASRAAGVSLEEGRLTLAGTTAVVLTMAALA